MTQQPRLDGTDDTQTGVLLVCGLAALAGAVDACGLAFLHDLYVSFMSGNTTSLGRALARHDWHRVVQIIEIVALFVGGAGAGEALGLLAGRYRLPAVVFGAALVLAVPPLARPAAVPAMTFAMGALNAAMQKAGPLSVSVTYVTGMLVKFGRGLGQLLCGRRPETLLVLHIVPWAGLLAGATLGAFCLGRFGERTYLALPPLALTLAACAYAAVPRPPA
jgi:uncharacterized membrane protein YoaK (UPF0700 family)